jgi:hypothetical protein
LLVGEYFPEVSLVVVGKEVVDNGYSVTFEEVLLVCAWFH